MNHIYVKPHPDLDAKAHPLIKHPASGGLLDAAGNVPDEGRPWLNDGFTARMLTDGAIIRGDHPAFKVKEQDRKDETGGNVDKPKPVEIRKPLPKPDADLPPAAK